MDTFCGCPTPAIGLAGTVFPSHDGQIAGIEKRLDRGFPSELSPDFGRSSHTDLPAEVTIAEQMDDRIREGLRFVRDQNVLPINHRKAFDTDGSRDDGLLHCHRLENLQSCPSTDSEWNHVDRRLLDVWTNVFDTTGHADERIFAAERLDTGKRISSDDCDRHVG